MCRSLKLPPSASGTPAAASTAFAAVYSVQSAVEFLTLPHRHLHAGLTGFELMGRFALSLVHTDASVLQPNG